MANLNNKKKYIGNVVVPSPNFKVEDCYNKCMSIYTIDTSLPTIIIGLQNAKNQIDNFSILKKKYNDNDMVWWTFSKSEKRVDYDKDMTDFYKFCIDNIINNIKYYYININNLTLTEVKKYIEKLNNNNRKYYFIHNDKFVFIYDFEDTKNIYGISLSTCAFYGLKKSKMIDLVKKNPNNKQIKNFYNIPNNIRRMVNDEIPRELTLLEYFIKN